MSGTDDRAGEQAEMLANRIRKNVRRLKSWRKRQQVTCYRVYERDIPELPFAVDRYEAWAHVSEFDRPHERTPEEHDAWVDRMAIAVSEALSIDIDRVFVKRRSRQRGASQYTPVDRRNERFEVGEGGLRFLVNLSDYVDTGLFLDHRPARGRVRDEAHGQRVLNLFCYTGAFSVYAAAGGATRVDSVDLSATYLAWAEDNLRLNGFDDPARFPCHRGDVRAWLRAAAARGARWDLAVVDPPTFSNSARTDEDWVVTRDHVELLQLVLDVMVPGGVVWFSTNARRFALNPAATVGADVEDVTDWSIPDDFRNRRIHSCYRLTRHERT